MKKLMLTFPAFLLLGINAAQAATGAAYDGLFLILLFAGFLLLLYLMLTGIDFLSRNGKRIVHAVHLRIHAFLHRIFRRKRMDKVESIMGYPSY